MLVKAVKSFVGKICMHAGEVREIVDEKLAKDLLRAGHVVEVKAEKAKEKKATKSKTEQVQPATAEESSVTEVPAVSNK